MIVPFIIAIIYEILMTIPIDLRQASLALGATKWETITRVVIPQMIPGFIAGVVLGASRALGETMAVLMVTKIPMPSWESRSRIDSPPTISSRVEFYSRNNFV